MSFRASINNGFKLALAKKKQKELKHADRPLLQRKSEQRWRLYLAPEKGGGVDEACCKPFI